MERSGHFQRRNPSHSSPSSSSSTSYRQSAHSRSNRFAKSAPNSVGRRISGHQEPEAAKNEPSDPPAIAGTCPFMCPEEERAQRERLRDLAVFERLNGNPSLSSPSLAVKKFCRTITSKQVRASDVRPLPILEDTLTYLLNLLHSAKHPFEVIQDFIFDRTRSIRQDLTMQHIVNDRAIRMYQKMVKFHVISHYKLRNHSSFQDASSLHYLNLEQLTKSLTSLFDLYEGESLSLWFRHVPSSIMRSKEMCFARELLRFFRFGNYKRFLNAVAAEASCLQYCIIEPYVNEVRALALAFINNGGYKLHPYPLAHLSNLLMMKVSEVESFCNACGLETCTDEEGNKLLPMKQTTFCRPKGGFMRYGLMGLDQFEDQLLNCAAGEGE
ncbi:SAC3 family protein C isoform X2 [Morus notabilis]|uniref:SAC3 family protein C isoform X2 n=1 Tax=Morus notabilis TaxID=981085 RepID=UPI000CED585B|nr:SAC3 family protein C isoform X2 [Morus notabilis]